MIRTIPLSKLVPSPRNVRRRSDEQADLELKADLAARGLLQNLVVTKARKPRGSFAVEAGERRRRALQSLVEDGALPADFGVCCLVVAGVASGREASLAENFQRLAMNPADECLAFQQLIEQGADVESIARRFGLTTRFVEGRLRLAGLAPVVFEALGSGDISLDVAKAYATTPDLERQRWVFEQLASSYSANHPDSIRRMMTQATVSAGDRRARFVGEEAYVAAGGRIERDLFSDESAARWLDVALLERLAAEKMDTLASQAVGETGLAFVRPTLDSWVGYAQLEGLRRVPLDMPELNDHEIAAIDAMQEEIDSLALVLDDEDADEAARAKAEAQIDELTARIDAIALKRPVLDDALKTEVGTFLLLDERGNPCLDTGYYREVADDEPAAVGNEPEAEPAPPTERKTAGLPQRLADELAIQRRDILAVHVAADPVLALDLAIFLMIDRETGYWHEKSGSSLTAAPPADPVAGFRTPDAAATVARERANEALDRSWTLAGTQAARFDAFRALAQETRTAWLGYAVAATLEASLGLAGGRACAFHDHLGALLGIDVAQWWRPTGANYFDRVPKSVALAALAEVGGASLAERYAKSKKAELSQSCERLFAGEIIAEAEVKEAALAWVPEAMRFVPAPDIPAEVPVDDAREAVNGDDPVAAGESGTPTEEIGEAA